MGSRAGFRRRWTAAAACAALLLVAARPAFPAETRRPADHVILVSIDGLVPEAYLRPQKHALGTLTDEEGGRR